MRMTGARRSSLSPGSLGLQKELFLQPVSEFYEQIYALRVVGLESRPPTRRRLADPKSARFLEIQANVDGGRLLKIRERSVHDRAQPLRDRFEFGVTAPAGHPLSL
jgi:hypothetical protein